MNLSVSVLRQKYRRYGEYMWYAALILLLIPVYLGFCDTASLKLLKYALLLGSLMGYCLLGLKIYFLDGRGPKELALFTGIFLLLGLGVVFSGTRALFSVFLLALGARDVPFSRIAKLCLCFFLGVLALNTLLVFAGVLEDTLLIRGEVWGQGNVRHTLGFGYPNTLALWGGICRAAGVPPELLGACPLPGVLPGALCADGLQGGLLFPACRPVSLPAAPVPGAEAGGKKVGSLGLRGTGGIGGLWLCGTVPSLPGGQPDL